MLLFQSLLILNSTLMRRLRLSQSSIWPTSQRRNHQECSLHSVKQTWQTCFRLCWTTSPTSPIPITQWGNQHSTPRNLRRHLNRQRRKKTCEWHRTWLMTSSNSLLLLEATHLISWTLFRKRFLRVESKTRATWVKGSKVWSVRYLRKLLQMKISLLTRSVSARTVTQTQEEETSAVKRREAAATAVNKRRVKEMHRLCKCKSSFSWRNLWLTWSTSNNSLLSKRRARVTTPSLRD